MLSSAYESRQRSSTGRVAPSRRELTLREYTPLSTTLRGPELRQLLGLDCLSVVATPSQDDAYNILPGSKVGAVATDDLSIVIQPKLEIRRLLFLLTFSLDPAHWRTYDFDYAPDDYLYEAAVPGFVNQVVRALRRDPLQGYRRYETAENTIRGRIRFDDQLRRRYGQALPVELAFDEFTVDIVENRLLKCALGHLSRLQLRHPTSRRSVSILMDRLRDVTSRPYSPANFPSVRFHRLNEHYRPAVQLAELIIRGSWLAQQSGSRRSSGFLIDMNEVFETFVVVALREALDLDDATFIHGDRRLRLDSDSRITLVPDFSWWHRGKCIAVGDVKYKALGSREIKNADVYQVLAYAIAADVPEAVLIYASGEREPTEYSIDRIAKRVHVVTLGLNGEPEEILSEISDVAERIRWRSRKASLV